MLKIISLVNNNNNYPKINRGKQHSCNFLQENIETRNTYPSPEQIKAVYFGSKKKKNKLFKKEEILEKSDIPEFKSSEEKNEYCDLLHILARRKLGVDIDLPWKVTGVRLQKELFDWLCLYDELGYVLPDRIKMFERSWDINKDGKKYSITRGHCTIGNVNGNSKIYINKNIFTDEYKEHFKIKDEREFLEDFHKFFHHELVHLQHDIYYPTFFTPGYLDIFDEQEIGTYSKFKKLYLRHSEEFAEKLPVSLKETHFDLEKEYHINIMGKRCKFIKELLSEPDKLSPEARIDFNDNYINKLIPVLDKICKTRELIDDNFRDYALKNSKETIAVAGETEFKKGPIENPEVREMLKKIGKLDSRMFSILPDN